MKTKAYIFMLVVVMTAAFACTREELDSIVETTPSVEENSGNVLVPFTTEAGEPQTRAAMDGSTTNIVFSAGDQLMVYFYQLVEPSILTLKSGAGNKSAVFSGDLVLASGKTEADLAGKKLFAVLIPEAGVSSGVFTYDPSTKKLSVDYFKGAIDSDLEALVSRTILYQGETTYEAKKFSFRMLNSYVKMNVTVPSEESDLARDYTVAVTNDWHISAKATCNRFGWDHTDEASTVSGTFTASSATAGTLYMAVLADDQIRLTDDGAKYDEVDFSIAMDNTYKEYDLTGGTISKAIIEPGKGYAKAVTLTDRPSQDVLLGQPESVRNRIMSTYHYDLNHNGYLSKYEAAQIKSCKMYGNDDLTDASFYGYFKGMTTFEEETLVSCDNMTKVILPKYITAIGNSAFEGCSKLGSVIIPSGVTSLGNLAFYNCTDLSRIVIPSSVTTIGESAFQYCSDMTEVVFETPARIATIGENAFKKCTSLEDFYFPYGVTAIAANTFEGCTSLKSVSMTSSVTSIGASAFYKCTSLQGIEIPQTVKSIGSQAFSYCSTIATVTIPALVERMGISTFEHCTSLRTVYCYPTVPPKGNGVNDSGFFTGCSNLTIYVPAESVSTYKSNFDWHYWKGIIQPM